MTHTITAYEVLELAIKNKDFDTLHKVSGYIEQLSNPRAFVRNGLTPGRKRLFGSRVKYNKDGSVRKKPGRKPWVESKALN